VPRDAALYLNFGYFGDKIRHGKLLCEFPMITMTMTVSLLLLGLAARRRSRAIRHPRSEIRISSFD
jgi:hypothetical protein